MKHVQAAFASNWLSTAGPNLTELEQRFAGLVGLPSVAVSTGTAGILLALRCAGIKPGDEVVTGTLNFVGGANPIKHLGATPVFIDSETASWNLNSGLLADFLSERACRNRLPNAILVPNLFGQSADLDEILGIAGKYDVPVIENNAESLGSIYKNRFSGTQGALGVFSFNGNKIITGTTGGMVVAQNAADAEQIRKWSTQARDPDPEGINNYYHSELGYNYRMSNIIAGIVVGQLDVLEQRVQQRRAVFERYRIAFAELPGIEAQPEAVFGGLPGSSRHTRWLSCFLVDEQRFGMSLTELIRHLDAANIETRPVWRPMHLQPLYANSEIVGGSVAEDLHHRGVCLPSSSLLSEEEQAFVITRIHQARDTAKQRG